MQQVGWKWAGAIVFVGLIAFLWIRGTPSHDMEGVVFRDPRDGTMLLMHLLQNYAGSLANLGQCPRTVRELASDLARDNRGNLRFDAWNRPFAFTRSGELYELRSPGPDGSSQPNAYFVELPPGHQFLLNGRRSDSTQTMRWIRDVHSKRESWGKYVNVRADFYRSRDLDWLLPAMQDVGAQTYQLDPSCHIEVSIR